MLTQDGKYNIGGSFDKSRGLCAINNLKKTIDGLIRLCYNI